MMARGMRVLNVAEKNDAAKSLADLMSRGRYRRREGYSKYNKIYEYDYQLFNQDCSMTMTSVSGHLLNYEFVSAFKKWHSCNPVALFNADVFKGCPENFKDIKRTLEREARQHDVLIIWTDGDREGENIGCEIVDVCKAVKPRLDVYRARFSEITPQSISNACRNLGRPDERVSNAVDVRQQLDLRIGAAFTRFQTLRLCKVFPGILDGQLISFGSCQFPTLGFVVERYKQVEAFIPEAFYKIKVSHEVEDTKVEFNWKRHRLFHRLACEVLLQVCLDDPMATVTDVSSRSKSKWRPLPMDTVELEKLSSRKLRVGAKETMKIAEKLYTKGFISYPRTETNMFPKDFNLPELIQEQTQDQRWGPFAAGILQEGPTPRQGNKTDNAHPPIHPIKYTNTLDGNDFKVYELIVRHFLACCSKDAQGYETTVLIKIASEEFTAQGLMIVARNYLDVYPYDKWNAKVIPVFQQGETFQPRSIEMAEGETSPPPLLTEADLISLMEKHGIGTDATHAEHIETIKSRLYVGVRPDGKFVPGELGMGLVEGYDSMGYELSKPDLRAELEADLKRICDGVKDPEVVLREQIEKYRQVFIEAAANANMLDVALSGYLGQQPEAYVPDVNEMATVTPVRSCPRCNNSMILKEKKEGGWMVSCSGYPACKAAVWFPAAVQEATVSDEICRTCQPGPVKKIKFKFKRGSVPPMMPSDYIGCVGGCDTMLKEALDLNLSYLRPATQPQVPTTNARSNRGRGGAQRGGGGANGRGGGNNRRGGGNGGGGAYGAGGGGGANGGGGWTNGGGFGGGGGANGGGGGANGGGGLGGGGGTNGGRFGGGGGANGGGGFGGGGANRGGGFGRGGGANGGGGFRGGGGARGGGSSGFSSNVPQSRPPLNQVPAGGQSFFAGSNSNGGENAVVCNCGSDALRLTVKKEGPNNGRQFYKCNSGDCNFFLWADENATPTNPSTNQSVSSWNAGGNSWKTQNSSGNSSGNSWSSGSSGYESGKDSSSGPRTNNWGEVMCQCGQAAVLRTVQKEGPNKGKDFHCCGKPQGKQCKFFEWTDGNSGLGGTGGGGARNQSTWGGSGGSKRGGFSKRGGASSGFGGGGDDNRKRKKPKCSICNQEGHTKRGCPMK
ncbi:DNA topoisomerase 3-alpha-like [Patiria miniata]|uniref:DNA topoisomerase n=1 Tax=Patiria miniata TaxID=46514 RepID=A0A914AJB3_PATMI|nr:DNA topoisomerase 3-alpha-like [Patiria miniata]